MHVGRASEAVLTMSDDFLKLHSAVADLVKKFEEDGISLKIQFDPSSGTVRISSDNTDSVTLAKSGLEDVSELAYATAEHHPYWSILYNGSQILRMVLEKWNDKLTADELNEMAWYAEEIKNTSTKVDGHTHDD